MTQISYWTATAFASVPVVSKPKEPVTLYNDDGSMYTGHVNENGAKHGQGTLKTEICVTGVVGDENSHCVKWTEFTGNWDNGLMHGHGVMREVSSNDTGIGLIRVVYEGMWDNGVPAPAPEKKQEEEEQEDADDDDNDDDLYPDYKHCSHDFPNFGRHRSIGAFAIMCNACHKRYTDMQHETI
jgi:hypothetical protein